MKRASFCFLILATGLFPPALGCGGSATSSTGTGASGGTTTSTGGAGGGTTTTSTAGGGAGGSGGSGGGTTGTTGTGACDGYQGQAPLADIDLSPYPDMESEVLAIEASGKLVAPQHVYERINADLQAIRAQNAQVQAITAMPSWVPEQVGLLFDAAGLAAVQNGTYTAWDCPNAWYGLKDKMVVPSLVVLTFHHRFHAELLAKEYAMLPNVKSASPNGQVGDGNDVCVSFDQETYNYVFDAGSGDCEAGCINHTYWGFTTKGTPVTITPLGTFSTPAPQPDWFKALGACTKWL
jgi:hypothetical protein